MSDNGDGSRGGYPPDVLSEMMNNHSKHMQAQDYDAYQHKTTASPSSTESPEEQRPRTFTHYVQSGLSSIWNLPQTIQEAKANMQRIEEERKQSRQEEWQRWTGNDNSPDDGQMLVDRASPVLREEAADAARVLLKEAHKRNAHVPLDKIQALYSDDRDWRSNDVYYDHWSPSTVPFAKSLSQWLSIAWFRRDPYSPLNVEAYAADRGMSDDICWRLAFEDLLNASLDKPMTSTEKIGYRPPHGVGQSTLAGPGLDWMLSLQCRGILPPQLPGLWAVMDHTKPQSSGPTGMLAALLEERDRPRSTPMPLHQDFEALIDAVATPGPEMEPSELGNFCPASDSRPDYIPQQLLQDYQMRLMQVEQETKQRLKGAAKQADDLCDGVQEHREHSGIASKPDTELDMYQGLCGRLDDEVYQEVDDAIKRITENVRLSEAIVPEDHPWLMRMAETQQARDRFPPNLRAAVHELGLTIDADKIANLVNDWHKKHGEVSSLLVPYLAMHSDQPANREVVQQAATVARLGNSVAWLPDEAQTEQFRCNLWCRRQEAEDDMETINILMRGLARSTLPDNDEWKAFAIRQIEECKERLEQEAEALGLTVQDAKTTEVPAMRDSTTQTPPQAASTNKVDVLSSLTTTQTTRLPDGTVTTKVVLKQRFADGREEVHEKEHTYQEAMQQQEDLTKREEQPKKSGWFWS